MKKSDKRIAIQFNSAETTGKNNALAPLTLEIGY